VKYYATTQDQATATDDPSHHASGNHQNARGCEDERATTYAAYREAAKTDCQAATGHGEDETIPDAIRSDSRFCCI